MSAYIKLSTLEYPRHIGDIEIDPAGMADYAHVEWVDPPAFDRETQRCTQLLPQRQGDQWFMAWEVTQIPEPEMSAKVRDKRNKLLAESDWTQLSDSPADRAAWAAYRQALRDISMQPGFPWTVDWPVAPGA
jgi:hypothetical protein